MIPLPKETIDNLFEPRRELRTAAELEAATNRLLIDGKGRFFCLTRQRGVDHGMYFHWHRPSRSAPEQAISHSRAIGWKKGTYPAWIDTDVATNIPWTIRPADNLRVYEYLPQPTHQQQLMLAFYRIAFPDWDDIVKIDGWPQTSKATQLYIAKKFQAFDQRMHPDVMPGGAWCLGAGFGGARDDESIPDWTIDVSPCKLIYATTPFYFTITESHYGEPPEEGCVYRASLIYDGGLRDAVDPDNEYARYATPEQAMAACEKRAGQPVTFERLTGPVNIWGEGVWQSNIVAPAVRRAA